MPTLAPTLWRTCRVLANPRRLACLRAVLRGPGQTVGELAAHAGVAEALASLYLRQIQARGLIRADRGSRWVRYRAAADASVTHAAPLLAALSRLLGQRRTPRFDDLLRALTAFTHPRRLVILRALADGAALSAANLTHATDISEPALYRHLDKLTRHGVTTDESGRWRLRCRLHPLAAALLRETRHQQAPSAHAARGGGDLRSHTLKGVRNRARP